jgi:hypothetical protein
MPVHTRNSRNGAKFKAEEHVNVLYNPPNNMKGPKRGRYKGIIHKVEQIHRGEQHYLVNIFDRNISRLVLVPENAIRLLTDAPKGGSRRKPASKRRRTHRR